MDSGAYVGGINILDGWLPIFPEEIWLMIFDHIDDDVAVYNNLVNALPQFENLLQRKKAAFLYPEVMKILAENKYIAAPSDLLNCRLVSKRSRQVVDGVLEEDRPEHFKAFPERSLEDSFKALQHPFVQDHGENGHTPTSLALKLFDYEPEGMLRIRNELIAYNRRQEANVMGHENNPPINSPFPARRLYLHDVRRQGQILDMNTILTNRTLAIEVLNHGGQYFWYCDIRTHSYDHSDLVQWYISVVEMLSRMRNLRALLLDYPSGRQNGYHYEQLWELSQAIQLNPFPVLPKMEMMVIKEVPEDVAIAALMANCYVPRLRLSGSTRMMHLCQSLQSLTCTFTSTLDFQSCLTMRTMPIEHIQMDFMVLASFVPWNDLFRFLERFHNTLTHLEISMPLSSTILLLNRGPGLLRLPFVKVLRLGLHILTGIDFILGLPSLEKLYVNITYTYQFHECRMCDHCRERFGEKIRLNCHFERMYESNIWELIPSLKYLTVTVPYAQIEPSTQSIGAVITFEYFRELLDHYMGLQQVC